MIKQNVSCKFHQNPSKGIFTHNDAVIRKLMSACLSSYAKLAKRNQAISRKLPKTFFVAKIWPILAHIRLKYFFLPLKSPSPVKHHACLSSYAKLAKSNDAISSMLTVC